MIGARCTIAGNHGSIQAGQQHTENRSRLLQLLLLLNKSMQALSLRNLKFIY